MSANKCTAAQGVASTVARCAREGTGDERPLQDATETFYHVSMRVLVAALDAYTREALVRATGGDAVATGIEYLPNAVRSLQPDVLILDAGGDTEATRVALERGRAAAEMQLPAVLLLSANSLWLHGVLPASLLPCVAVARTVERHAIASALARLSG